LLSEVFHESLEADSVMQVEEAEKIYDEVDEDDYRSVVRGRLMEDDFVIDEDGASGYADNGMDDWDEASSEEEERQGQSLQTKNW
jgi:DNA polymerase alpha subunit A